jgi:regulator of cell morphogenesis and NO signaling
MQTIDRNSRVGEIVAEDYRTAGVFKKYGIDFCCGGGRTLDEACKRGEVAVEELVNALEETAATAPGGGMNFNDWDTNFLIDFIVNKHHLYVREKLPELTAYADKVARVHGERHPETLDVARMWRDLADELSSHLEKEERVLFPYIKQQVRAQKTATPAPVAPFGTVQNPIRMMEVEHDVAGEIMRQINELTGGFTPPEDACMTYRVLYANLREFEENLHEHVHLENNILFPRAVAMEG